MIKVKIQPGDDEADFAVIEHGEASVIVYTHYPTDESEKPYLVVEVEGRHVFEDNTEDGNFTPWPSGDLDDPRRLVKVYREMTADPRMEG